MPDSICGTIFTATHATHKRKTAFAMHHIIVVGWRLVLCFSRIRRAP